LSSISTGICFLSYGKRNFIVLLNCFKY
jgi:hypothetical protein